MKIKIHNFYTNLNKYLLYENNKLKNIQYYDYCIIRINLFYLHDSLFKNSINKDYSINSLKRKYYLYLCNKKVNKYIINEQVDFLKIQPYNKTYKQVLSELIRQRRVINLLINIYNSEKNEVVLENLVSK